MMLRFYELLDEEGQFLSDSAKLELPILGRRLCGLYNVLACEACVAMEKRWKSSPKMHVFLHVCEWQGPELGNPKYYWAYADEDLVGQVIDIAHACHPRTMAVTTLFRWLTVVYVELGE